MNHAIVVVGKSTRDAMELEYGKNEIGSCQKNALIHFQDGLKTGEKWPLLILETLAMWASPVETYRGRKYNYFIAGEAFDWLLLSERLCESAGNAIPRKEKMELIFSGEFPPDINTDIFKRTLGVDKYRASLNYFYGIVVENALQLATELEIQKHHIGNGVDYKDNYAEETFTTLYMATTKNLLKQFLNSRSIRINKYLNTYQSKEFTYWLFQLRIQISDKAKIASDTKKGLEQLRKMDRYNKIYFHEQYSER